MANLSIFSQDKLLQEVQLKKTVIIGRETGDIIIKNPGISARHVKIEKDGSRFIVHDLNSTNGTFVNDKKVDSMTLSSGDVITVGKYSFKFDDPEQKNPDETLDGFDDIGGRTIVMDSSKIKSLLEQPPGASTRSEAKESAKLFMSQGSGAPKVMKLEKDTALIGTSNNSDIQIKGFTIGRIAASITRNGDQYEISYQGGLAKLRMDGETVEKHTLSNGDKFSIASYDFEFRTEL